MKVRERSRWKRQLDSYKNVKAGKENAEKRFQSWQLAKENNHESIMDGRLKIFGIRLIWNYKKWETIKFTNAFFTLNLRSWRRITTNFPFWIKKHQKDQFQSWNFRFLLTTIIDSPIMLIFIVYIVCIGSAYISISQKFRSLASSWSPPLPWGTNLLYWSLHLSSSICDWQPKLLRTLHCIASLGALPQG